VEYAADAFMENKRIIAKSVIPAVTVIYEELV
jgi:hypothetical protein